jgi:quercetin dioxygenase-like cupin family protein
MQNLMIGLALGALVGAASTALVAQRRPGTYPDAVTADPKHYTVAFENDVARFLRVKYAPGEKSPMHRHLPGCVVFLTDQTFNFTVPDGSTEPASVAAGSLGCSDGNVHAAENIGGEAEFIMVEFKDRTTFRR